MGGTYSQPRPIDTRWFDDFERTLPSLDGKVVAITGCTTGTGFVCARTCARKGAHVVMLNRRSERAVAAQAQIERDVPNATLTAIECDLTSVESVRAAAKAIQEKFGETGLDVLCNNAGVMALRDQATKDGYDVQMQTNHLSHFVLSKELFGCLETAAAQRGEARIVYHSSLARKGADLDAKYFGKNGGRLGGDSASMLFGGARWARYHQTKLANAVMAAALAEKLAAAGSKVKAVCAAPGIASTNLQVTTAADNGMAETFIMRWAQSAEDGTMPLLTCVAGTEVANGEFYEPTGIGMKGLPAKKELEASCTSAKNKQTLWGATVAEMGEWAF